MTVNSFIVTGMVADGRNFSYKMHVLIFNACFRKFKNFTSLPNIWGGWKRWRSFGSAHFLINFILFEVPTLLFCAPETLLKS